MTAILAIWNDRDPATAEHYERWYSREHLRERVGVPGFRFGRRYEALEADRQFFSFYEVDAAGVLASPEYMRLQNNPTPWTRQAMTGFRHMSRTVCEVAFTAGILEGAHAVTLRWTGPTGDISDGRRQLAALSEEDGIGRVHLWMSSAAQTPPTAEMTTRREPDERISGAVVVECLREDDACRARGRAEAVVRSLSEDEVQPSSGVYRLLCVLHHAAAISQD